MSVRVFILFALLASVFSGCHKEIMLYEAVETQNIPRIKELIEAGTNLNVVYEGMTVLHMAAKIGNVEIVNIFLEAGANVDAKDSDDATPLHYAAVYGHLAVVKQLITAGADISARDEGDMTVLLKVLLLEKPNPLIVKTLILKGAKINQKYNPTSVALSLRERLRKFKGMTPLHIAVWQGHTILVPLLIRLHADVNARDANGNTPLHIAAWKNRKNIAKILLKARANINALNNDNMTPLQFANKKYHNKMVKFFREHGGK